MSFPRYPEYKDSGVEWLGGVPRHWESVRYKNVFDEKTSIAGTSLPPGSISFGRVIFKDDEFLHEPTKASYQEVLSGEFLINPINLNYDLKSLRTALSEIDTCVSPAYIVLQTKVPSDKNYLKYQLHVFDLFHMKTLGAGVRQTITFGDIGVCFTCIPPLPEQTQIAAFLDSETAKIDTLVAEQRRLMELLKEKRQAVISHAVTRGLNPDAPMKPSGIEWLGDMPEHWEVMVIKRFSTLHRGHDLTDAERTDGTYPVVTSSGINGTHGSFMAFGPGVVTGRYGSTGKLFYIEDNFWPHNTSLYVSNFHGNTVRFVWYSLQTVDFAAHSAKAAVPGIDRNDIHVLPVVVPPKDEQATIVAFLESELAKLDTLTTEAQLAIDLLQERRTALISAAVTGQIDVRCVLQ